MGPHPCLSRFIVSPPLVECACFSTLSKPQAPHWSREMCHIQLFRTPFISPAQLTSLCWVHKNQIGIEQHRNPKAPLRKQRGRKRNRKVYWNSEAKPLFRKSFLISSCFVGTAWWHHLKTLAMTEWYIKDFFYIGSLKKILLWTVSARQSSLSPHFFKS